MNKYLTTPLLFLKESSGSFRFYKLVRNDWRSPFAAQNGAGEFLYEIGKEYTEICDEDETVVCGRGLHVATLDWCIINHQQGWRIISVEVKSEDIKAIPTGTDGKIRVSKLKVVGEVSLADVGLVS